MKAGLNKALDENLADLENFLAVRDKPKEDVLWIQVSGSFFYIAFVETDSIVWQGCISTEMAV
jgi:hypothetical protein